MHADCSSTVGSGIVGIACTAEVMDVLSTGLSQSKPITVITAQPHPYTYTATPPAPPPASVPVAGVSKSRFSSCHSDNSRIKA